MIEETLASPAAKQPPLDLTDKTVHRVHPEEIEAGERVKSFIEVEQPLTFDAAIKEAKRCLKCDLAYNVEKIEADMGYCIFCGLCVEACPRDSLFMSYEYEKARYHREEFVLNKEKLLFDDKSTKKRSGFCRPKMETVLPKQTLLQDKDKIK